jgi:hypothetical protein
MSIGLRLAACATCSLAVAACASGQLNYNTLDLASTVDDLITKQVVYNLGKFWIDPSSNPTQVTVSAGSISTTNQASLSWANPLNTAVTTTDTAMTAAGAVVPALTHTATGVVGSATLTPSGTNQATQNWSVNTDADSDQERRLRALYRFATHTDYDALCSEYPLIVTSGSVPSTTLKNDTGAWDAAVKLANAEGYADYIKAFPRGFHVAAAELWIRADKHPGPNSTDTANWKKALQGDTPSDYLNYLNAKTDYKKSYENEAHEQLARSIGIAGAETALGSSQPVTVVSTPSGGMTVTAMDAQFLREPGCVICSATANIGNINVERHAPRFYCKVPRLRVSDLYVNPRLTNGWLHAAPVDGVLDDQATVLGRYKDVQLYTTSSERYRQFILFVLEATNEGSATGQSGKGSPSNKGLNAFTAGPVNTLLAPLGTVQ